MEKTLREANAELEQFAFIASHDLKEPARTLNTFATYLLDDIEASNEELISQDVQFIQEAAVRMMTLIDDLLELSRAGNVPLQHIS
jgi:light-regulated signal transduction histidine kinase (bacteriophytochrome)